MLKKLLPEDNLEVISGLLIAIFATCLAVIDLYAGKFGDDEIIASNEKSATYEWFQAKGVKEIVAESQVHMLKSLVTSGAVVPKDTAAMNIEIGFLEKKAKRYSLDKEEVLKGSKNIDSTNWSQYDNDGKLGNIKGAFEWEKEVKILSAAGDTFDTALFFMQIALVFGAVSLILKSYNMKIIFLSSMTLLSLVGIIIGFIAFKQAIILY
ncbi:MAG: hypothetical protein CFE21_13380 [Bacteroidetes bacterium B1(2017)]|nr:MAG: hypothetical protein CFE21_13380 [Bacteroidetes bacterium B1(2017)]